VDEDELFAQAMGKVKPITASDKLTPQQRPRRIRLQRSDRSGSIHHAEHGHVHQVPESTEDPWILRADGISRERLKRLGSSVPGLTLDLHGLTRDEALSQLEDGFHQSILDSRIRVVCIVHGRGLHSQGKPVLKEAVYRWLREGAMARVVLAAIPQPGSGGGACLVLLRRKS